MNNIKESQYFILGMGNIGKILVKRLLEVGVLPENIKIFDPDAARMAAVMDQWAVQSMQPGGESTRQADVILLATPPKVVTDVLAGMAGQLDAHQIIISLAAAVPISRMRAAMGPKAALVRVLPNPHTMVGQGVNPVAFEPGTPVEVKNFVFALLEQLGSTFEVQDDQMTWCVGLSGAILRTVLPVLEGLTLAGIEAGLSAEEARRVAALNVAGVAALVLKTDLSWEQIRALTPMQTLDEKMVADLFLETARNTRQKVEETQAKLSGG